jgi:hypothetical protein
MLLKINKSDIMGVAASGLCLVHCLLLPVFLCFGDSCSSSSFLDFNADYLFLGLSGSAVFFVSRRSVSGRIKYLLWGFFALALAGFSMEYFFEQTPWLLYAGSAGLISVHAWRIFKGGACC